MPLSAAIKEGFRLVNGNWQLVVVHFVVSVASFLGFLLIVGVPLIAAFLIMGIDLARMGELGGILNNVEDSIKLIDNYLGLLAVGAVGLFIYLVFAFSLFIFSLGGTAGVIARSIKEGGRSYSTHFFMSEGRRLFMPLMGYTSLVGLVFLCVFIVLAVGAGATAFAWETFTGLGKGLGLFFKVLITLTLATAFLAAIFASVLVTAVGIARMALEGMGAVKAMGEAFRYIDRRPGVALLMFVMVLGYMAVQAAVALVGFPIQMVPFVGLFLALPFQLFTYALQGYLSLVIMASVFAHCNSAIAGGSTQGAGTSPEGAFLQGPPHAGWGPHQQA